MILRVARREMRERWWVILLAALVAASVVYVAGNHFHHKKQWTASTTLILAPSSSSGGKAGVTTTLELGESLATSPAILATAAHTLKLKFPPGTKVPSNVSTAISASSETLTITVLDPRGPTAAAFALAVGGALINYESTTDQKTYQKAILVANQQVATLNAKVSTLSAELQAALKKVPPGVSPNQFDLPLRQKLATASAQAKSAQLRASSLATNGPSGPEYLQLDQALTNSTASSTIPSSRAARAGLAAVLAILLALIALAVLARVDTRIRSREAAEAAFGVPVLAEIPRMSRRARRSPISTQSATAAGTAYRALAVNLVDLGVEPHPMQTPESRVIAVASALQSEGRSTVAAHLAVSASLLERSVLVVDADLPRPGVADLLGASRSAQWPEDESISSTQLGEMLQPASVEGVRVLPFAGSENNPLSVVPRIRHIANDLRSEANFLIMDIPPLLDVPESLLLAGLADRVLVVCRWGRTSRSAAWLIAEQLARLDAPVVGVVIVAAPVSRRSFSRGSRVQVPVARSSAGTRQGVPAQSQSGSGDGFSSGGFPGMGAGARVANGSSTETRSTVLQGDNSTAG
jgi:Mrp family chromosome partitioning ATPase